MVKIINPILTGFHPDPCLCKANNKYYLITSTFEWLPGISIYESDDLVTWKSLGGILQDISLLGIPDSAGIWAPALSYDGNMFYLVYTVSKQIDGYFKDVENYVITSKNILGPWSKPYFINASGFDPSMYHENGKHYVLNPQWDARPLPNHKKFNGLILQEFDFEKGMVGEAKVVFTGSKTGGTEGPHLMKEGSYYYIIAAEGGTGRHHSICVARSKNIWGPYVISPYHPLITSWEKDTILKKSGHGNFVRTNNDEWYLVHLCARYLPNKDVCVLGRETSMQKIEWIDEWPRMVQGDNAPLMEIEAPIGSNKVIRETKYNVDFSKKPLLELEGWLSLRTSFKSKLEFVENGLKIYGQDSLTSLHNQSLIARRWSHFCFECETAVHFQPYHYSHMAGLTCYYNTKCFYYIYVGYDEQKNRRIVNILCNNNFTFSEPLLGKYVYIPEVCKDVKLKVEVNNEKLQFYYAFEDGIYKCIGPSLDSTVLSDEHVTGWSYTGAVVGLSVIDTFNKDQSAIFSYFRQENKEK